MDSRRSSCQRAQRLAQLAGARALVLALQQARHLHGQRRAARDDAAGARRAASAARPIATRVDAAVRAEALVLEGHQHGQIARIDVLDLDRQPPAAVRRRVGAQQPVVAIEHRDRQRLGARQRQRRRAAARSTATVALPPRRQQRARAAAQRASARSALPRDLHRMARRAASKASRRLGVRSPSSGAEDAARPGACIPTHGTRLLPRRDLEAAGGGAREAVGAVHVLHRRRRMHERCPASPRARGRRPWPTTAARGSPRRCRAGRGPSAEEVEGGHEAVVAEVGVLRLHAWSSASRAS